MEQRKGAKNIASIPPEILKELNLGTIQSANLVEWLAINQLELLKNVLIEWNLNHEYSSFEVGVQSIKKPGVNSISNCIGKQFARLVANNDLLLQRLQQHPADMVRNWAAYTLAELHKEDLDSLLNAIKPLAADEHFGVREVAWMAVRPIFALSLENGIEVLKTWTLDKNDGIRRFASEVSRPRGVWCAHIEQLKSKPELGFPILNALYRDPSKYVRDSVANWLNDASKSKPDFVTKVCENWLASTPDKNTQYTVSKAMRTINKSVK